MTAPTPAPTPVSTLDTDRIEAAARALLDDKVTAVRAPWPQPARRTRGCPHHPRVRLAR